MHQTRSPQVGTDVRFLAYRREVLIRWIAQTRKPRVSPGFCRLGYITCALPITIIDLTIKQNMKTILITLVTLGSLSSLTACSGPMTSQQAQAWSEALGSMSNTVGASRTQYQQQQAPSYTCRNYGSFTNCNPS
jgi:hypothetical protein